MVGPTLYTLALEAVQQGVSGVGDSASDFSICVCLSFPLMYSGPSAAQLRRDLVS